MLKRLLYTVNVTYSVNVYMLYKKACHKKGIVSSTTILSSSQPPLLFTPKKFLWNNIIYERVRILKKSYNLSYPLLKDFGAVSIVLSWQNQTSTMWFFPDVGRQKHMESIWISVDINPVNSFYLFTYVYIYLFVYLLPVPAAALSEGRCYNFSGHYQVFLPFVSER